MGIIPNTFNSYRFLIRRQFFSSCSENEHHYVGTFGTLQKRGLWGRCDSPKLPQYFVQEVLLPKIKKKTKAESTLENTNHSQNNLFLLLRATPQIPSFVKQKSNVIIFRSLSPALKLYNGQNL